MDLGSSVLACAHTQGDEGKYTYIISDRTWHLRGEELKWIKQQLDEALKDDPFYSGVMFAEIWEWCADSMPYVEVRFLIPTEGWFSEFILPGEEDWDGRDFISDDVTIEELLEHWEDIEDEKEEWRDYITAEDGHLMGNAERYEKFCAELADQRKSWQNPDETEEERERKRLWQEMKAAEARYNRAKKAYETKLAESD